MVSTVPHLRGKERYGHKVLHGPALLYAGSACPNDAPAFPSSPALTKISIKMVQMNANKLSRSKLHQSSAASKTSASCSMDVLRWDSICCTEAGGVGAHIKIHLLHLLSNAGKLGLVHPHPYRHNELDIYEAFR